jgi:hypothetical protein
MHLPFPLLSDEYLRLAYAMQGCHAHSFVWACEPLEINHCGEKREKRVGSPDPFSFPLFFSPTPFLFPILLPYSFTEALV